MAPNMTMLIAYDGRENTEKALDYAIRNSVVYGEKLIILSVVAKGADTDIQRVRSIAESALENFDCDTIIVGRSGKTSLDRVILGSVSNSIVANAKCTVIVVQRRPSAFTRLLITLSGVGGQPGMYRVGSRIPLIPSPTTSP